MSCNQSLCTDIKAVGPISFKGGESVGDSHQFKTMQQLFIKKLLYCTKFLPALAFFLWDSPRASNVKKQTLLSQSSYPLLNYFPLQKVTDSISKFHIRKLKLIFLNFWWDKVNNCMFFLNCRYHELRFPALISAHKFFQHSCSPEMEKKPCDCITGIILPIAWLQLHFAII